MRWRQYIVFLSIFMLSAITAAAIDFSVENKIRDYINRAGAEHQPLIMSFNTGVWLGGDLYMTSPGHDSLQFFYPDPIFTQSMGIESDGTFYTTSHDYTNDTLLAKLYKFPERRPYQSVITNTGRSGNFLSFGFGNQNQGSCIVSKGYDGTILIDDILTSENTSLDVGDEPPWLSDDESTRLEWVFGISQDRNVIITAGIERGTSKPSILWRYDVENGTWSILGKHTIQMDSMLTCGPNGDIIAFHQSPSSTSGGISTPYTGSVYHPGMPTEVVFLDGRTGDVILTEPNVSIPHIGKRWASVMSGGIFSMSMASPKIILFDTLNEWHSASVDLPFGLFSYVLYEPPEDGLEEMYENYVED